MPRVRIKNTDKIKGTFEIASNPDPVIYVDDSYVTEGTDTSGSFLASLSKAQGSDVTLDYTISSDSTATSSDYSSLTSGTVTIPAGQTSASITYTLSDDTDAEGVIDETIKLTLSNPSSGIKLGREEAIAYIYDNDANRTAYEDYIGTYNAANETFTVTTGLKFDPSYEETDLTSPFTFTATDWLQNMKKTQQYGDVLYTEYRELNTWSSDTNSNYTIGKNSFENPWTNVKIGQDAHKPNFASFSEQEVNHRLVIVFLFSTLSFQVGFQHFRLNFPPFVFHFSFEKMF